VHPGNSSWLYAGTEIGVFTSTNNGASWSASNEGPATASVEELFFMDGATLVAATHGRGMFMASALPGTPPIFTSSPPANGSVGVGYTHNYTASGSPAPTFSLQAGAFPTGLSLNGTTGVLSGTPTAAGNFSGNVNATNTSGVVGQTFSITIAAQLPGAPTIGTATAGNAQASITFTPPASNGGSPITGYTASCSPGPVTANGAASPITVTGLTNGTLYTCSVRAINAAGTGPASGTVTVTPVSGVALALVSVKSRKNHGPSGTFDLLIDHTVPVGGAITIEPRAILAGHKIVFTFNDAITATGTATSVDETAAAVGSISAVAVGTTIEVTLTGVPPAKRVKVQLANVNGTFTTSASIGFLLGDVNASYKVTSSDILMITGRSGSVTASNFLFDVDVSGAVSLTDINTAKAQSGTSLP
jgi:large repetitive protein